MKGVVVSYVFIYNGSYMAKRASQAGGAVGSHEERFLQAFDEYADALYRHAAMRLSDQERAVELVHDAFTKAWGYVRGGSEIESYRPFLYKILGNLIIDEYRKKRIESLDTILADEGVDSGRFADLQEGSLNETLSRIEADRAIEAIQGLPVIYREILVLRFVDGLGPKEIATLIEESENVVSVRLNRGIKMLKEVVTKE